MMLLSISHKQGKLQLTEDGFLQVDSLVTSQEWREPVSAVSGISFKPGMLGSCAFIVYAGEAHLVTMVVRKDFDKLCHFLPGVPVIQVPDLQLPPVSTPEQPAFYPPAEIAQSPSPASAPPGRPTLKIASKGNSLQLTESGYLQLVRPLGSIVWSVLARQVTGIRSERKFPALTVMIDTPGGSYTAEMVSKQDFEKLQAAIAAYQ